MFLLRLACSREQIDRLSAELWEAGTTGIHEIDSGDEIFLIAGFASNQRVQLAGRFANYSPQWRQERVTDWAEQSRKAWPAREIGNGLFLAAAWCDDPTPPGRKRIVHNPGLACGTGEHPCTQLALIALEKSVRNGDRVVDIGTGSGILAIAALRLEAACAVGVDTDESALPTARRNFLLNDAVPVLMAGSCDGIAEAAADIAIANINGTVLLSILDDLVRITRPGGRLILTGFTEAELRPFQQLLRDAEVSSLAEWRCLTARLS